MMRPILVMCFALMSVVYSSPAQPQDLPRKVEDLEKRVTELEKALKPLDRLIATDVVVPLKSVEAKVTNMDTTLKSIEATLKSDFDKVATRLAGLDAAKISRNLENVEANTKRLESIETNTKSVLSLQFFVLLVPSFISLMVAIIAFRLRVAPDRLAEVLDTIKRFVQPTLPPLPPVVRAVVPNTIALAAIPANAMIDIFGDNFLQGAEALIGSRLVETTWVTGNNLRAPIPVVVPPLPAAGLPVAVKVINPDGRVSLPLVTFTYTP